MTLHFLGWLRKYLAKLIHLIFMFQAAFAPKLNLERTILPCFNRVSKLTKLVTSSYSAYLTSALIGSFRCACAERVKDPVGGRKPARHREYHQEVLIVDSTDCGTRFEQPVTNMPPHQLALECYRIVARTPHYA